jgi:hypothetical protein
MEKYLRVTMEDGSKWDVPAKIIAEDRARYYACEETKFSEKFNRVYEEELRYCLDDDYEIEDWAANNMNWVDVQAIAVKVSIKEVNFQEGWVNGEKEVIEK